jgi:hypothetical protein
MCNANICNEIPGRITLLHLFTANRWDKLFRRNMYVSSELPKGLKEAGEIVLNQLGKPKERPTLKWVFQKFRNINEDIIELKDSVHREIIN